MVTIGYDRRDENQPANFGYFNIGPKWTLNWLGYVEDDPKAPGTGVRRYLRDGAVYSYRGYDAKTRRFAPQEDDASQLVLSSTSPVTYRLFRRDGGLKVYAHSDGSKTPPPLAAAATGAF